MSDSIFKQALLGFWEIIKVVIISLAVILPVRYFLVQPFFVLGASMEPNFANGDYLIIDEASYRLGDPQRGQVIVFKYPLNPKDYYIKRIIGLPGETVTIKEGKVYIKNTDNPEGFWLDESTYINEYTGNDQEVTLREDEYFVLGDNRNASSDSRAWGALNRDFIVGKAWIRAFPFNQFEIYDF